MVLQPESQSPIPSTDDTEAALRAASVTPRQKTKSRKQLTKGTVTSTLAHNTRYATRHRSEVQAKNVATDAEDDRDTPTTPITMIRIPPRTFLANEDQRQQSALSSPPADEPPGKRLSRRDIMALSELLVVEQGAPATTTSAPPTNQASNVPAHPIQTPLATGSSSSNTGESLLLSTRLLYGSLSSALGYRQYRTT